MKLFQAVTPQLPKSDDAGAGRTPDVLAVGAAAAVVFLVHLFALPQDPFWLDAPEFIAAALGWGQVHPPGHPAAMPLLRGWLLAPLGSIAFRANAFSAFFGALTASGVGMLTLVLSRPSPSARIPRALGAATTVAFGLCASSVIQSMSVEIYTLNAALILWAAVLAVRLGGDARAAGLCGVLVGLGLANHHFLTVLAMPALLALFLHRQGLRRGLLTAWPAPVMALLVAAATYLYLPARSHGWPTWSDASTLSGTLWIASARVFAGSLGGFVDPVGGLARNAGMALRLLGEVLTWPGLLLAVLGLWRLGTGRRPWIAVGLGLLILGSLASKVAMGLLDPDNPDDHGYFLAAIAGLVVAQAVGLGTLIEGFAAKGRAASTTVAIVAIAAMAALPLPTGLLTLRDRAGQREAAPVMDLVWRDLPPRTVAFVSHYPIHFMTQYDQAVEGTRPDVTVVQQSFYSRARGGRYYASRIAERDGDLQPLVRAFLARGTLDWGQLRHLAERRPVRFEADPDLVLPFGDLEPAGWMFAVRHGTDAPAAGAASATDAAAPAPTLDPLASLRAGLPRWPMLGTETRRVVLRFLASSALWLDASGDRPEALRRVEAALELNPVDATLRAMRARMAP